MRRLTTLENYGFSDPAAHAQVGWTSAAEPSNRFAFFERHYQPGMAVLDAGCGNGLFYEWLDENGFKPDYWGVDMSEDFLGQFTERRPEMQKRLFQGTLTGLEWDADVLREGAPFDIVTLYGVGSDFGVGEQTKWNDLKEAIDRAWPLLKEGGKLIIDFWDEKEFTPPKGPTAEQQQIEAIVSGAIPPTSWAMPQMVEFLDGMVYEIHKPVVGMDFGVVLHKKATKKAPQEEQAAPGRLRVVFDFGDALTADARRTSIEAVDKAAEGVAGVLGELAVVVSKIGTWKETHLGFIEPIVENFRQAAHQLTRQWATSRKELMRGKGEPVTEQVRWEFASALQGDMDALKTAGDDKPRHRMDRVVAEVVREIDDAVDDVDDKGGGMSFPQDSGLVDSLKAASSLLRRDWKGVEQEWADR